MLPSSESAFDRRISKLHPFSLLIRQDDWTSANTNHPKYSKAGLTRFEDEEDPEDVIPRRHGGTKGAIQDAYDGTKDPEDTIPRRYDETKGAVQGAYDGTKDNVNDAVEGTKETVKDLYEKTKHGIQNSVQRSENAAEDAERDLKYKNNRNFKNSNVIESTYDDMKNRPKGNWAREADRNYRNTKDGVKNAYQDTKNKAQDVGRDLNRGADRNYRNARDGVKNAYQDTKNKAQDVGRDLNRGADRNYRNARDGAKNTYQDTKNKAQDVGRDLKYEKDRNVRNAEDAGSKIGNKIDNGVDRLKNAKDDLTR